MILMVMDSQVIQCRWIQILQSLVRVHEHDGACYRAASDIMCWSCQYSLHANMQHACMWTCAYWLNNSSAYSHVWCRGMPHWHTSCFLACWHSLGAYALDWQCMKKITAMDRFKLSYQTPKGIMEPIRFIDQDMKQVKHMERLQLKPGRNHFLLRTVRFNFVVTWLPERRLFPRWKIFCSKTAASVSRSTALWTRTCKGLFFKSLPVFW